MTATAAPFGFRPSYHPTGLDRATKYYIASGYGTALYKGMPVTLNTNGTIVTGAAAADIKGILAGVEFTDPSGKPNLQPNWPAGQTVQSGTQAVAWVWQDPDVVFDVQANGPVALTAIGDQADVVNVANGSALTGLSTSGLNSTLAGAGVQGQFRIVGLAEFPDNQWGDAFTIVRVQLARDQFVANKVAV